MVVEAKDVKFYEIAEVQTDTGPAVRIRGLVFHSSLAVERIEQRRTDDAIIVEVFLVPTKKGLSGSFATEVPLTNGVKRILFGSSAKEIWPPRPNA